MHKPLGVGLFQAIGIATSLGAHFRVEQFLAPRRNKGFRMLWISQVRLPYVDPASGPADKP
jgi:hypothetical protein